MAKLLTLGAYNGMTTPEENLIDTFKKNEKAENPFNPFSAVQKIAIEAPAATLVAINGTELKMPATGMLEFDYGFFEVTSLVFHSAVEVNIIYMY